MTELRIARIRAGLTAKGAAARLGIAAHTLSRIECGHTRAVSAALIVRMAAVYGCSEVDLLRAAAAPSGAVAG